jgi:alpha 1,6-mannosyltransferase
MLTTRKFALLVGATFFVLLLILKATPSSPSLLRQHPAYRDGTWVTTEGSWASKAKSKEEIERILEQSIRPLKSAKDFPSLRDHLEYLFPYQGPGTTKFPAYIWQTWKYTPAMGEFNERFRVTEASWTERHSDYVHEVPSRHTSPTNCRSSPTTSQKS